MPAAFNFKCYVVCSACTNHHAAGSLSWLSTARNSQTPIENNILDLCITFLTSPPIWERKGHIWLIMENLRTEEVSATSNIRYCNMCRTQTWYMSIPRTILYGPANPNIVKTSYSQTSSRDSFPISIGVSLYSLLVSYVEKWRRSILLIYKQDFCITSITQGLQTSGSKTYVRPYGNRMFCCIM